MEENPPNEDLCKVMMQSFSIYFNFAKEIFKQFNNCDEISILLQFLIQSSLSVQYGWKKDESTKGLIPMVVPSNTHLPPNIVPQSTRANCGGM